VVVPPARGRPDPHVCSDIRRECERRGWVNRFIRSEVLTDSAGKPLTLLKPEDAENLYQRAHRARLGVLTTTDVFVRLNPTRHVLDKRWLARLSRLIRYKAFHARISERTLTPTITAFVDWAGAVHCENERDPRVLPLHTFCPATDSANLDLAQGRVEFVRRHGPPTQRTCEQQLTWSPDPSHHGGREPQNVAGLVLTPGFHWDVVGERPTTRLLTLSDVWEVPRRQHVNVYPNGHIRSRRTGTVRRVAIARDVMPRRRRSRR